MSTNADVMLKTKILDSNPLKSTLRSVPHLTSVCLDFLMGEIKIRTVLFSYGCWEDQKDNRKIIFYIIHY